MSEMQNQKVIITDKVLKGALSVTLRTPSKHTVHFSRDRKTEKLDHDMALSKDECLDLVRFGYDVQPGLKAYKSHTSTAKAKHRAEPDNEKE